MMILKEKDFYQLATSEFGLNRYFSFITGLNRVKRVRSFLAETGYFSLERCQLAPIPIINARTTIIPHK
jgi:hypothetical protein